MAKLPNAKKVFVHKMLHQVKDGKISQGIESDVILLTHDGRFFLLEISTQTNADNLLRDFIKKRERYKAIGIQYDGLAYITACPTFAGYHTIDEKSRVFGAHHLGDLNRFLTQEFKL
ncbi:MAG: hypothetical protein JRN52_04060 [Nitrososphaerota archaeon]|nr:hypothetical protein [Nitrososphaerota archaeon]